MPANVFTTILPNLTTAFQRVAQERAPLPAIAQTDFRQEEAAVNQVVTIPIAPAVAGRNRTEEFAVTDAAARTVTSRSIAITKDREYPFALTGDDFIRMQQNPEYIPLSVTQALRQWRNEVHGDLADLHVGAAGYYSTLTPSSGAALGTAGTTPFASDISAIVQAEKLLNDSLAPLDGRYLMIDTAAKQNLGLLGQLTKQNEAGTADLLRRGIVGQLAGFNVVWGNDVRSGATIAGSGYLVNGTPAAGATSIPVDTGTGAIPAGTVVAFAGDAVNRYVVATAYAGGAGNITLTSGLVNAIADNSALTLSAGRRNMAFHREALGLAIRLPRLPDGGDMGDHQVITDPETGIQVRMSVYKGKGLNLYAISSAWGVQVVRPELLKLILG